MVDRVDRNTRGKIMRAVGTRNTGPEMAVRRMLHSIGYRYRLHRKDLPGTPDIVFPGRKKIIFVHGCFWHCHDCQKGRAPKSNSDYWSLKRQSNQARDKKNVENLTQLGWDIFVVWQCELKDEPTLLKKLEEFLG